jgi:D-amino peptidase
MRRAAAALVPALALAVPLAALERPLRFYISIDMEGISGIGVSDMTHEGGKDYAVGRRLMTAELNAAVEGLRAGARERGVGAEILVNDSHGDHRNVLIEELADGVEYLQGSVKPYGMMEGFEAGYDGVVFLGYHARAATRGLLAHTGSGRSVREVRLNGHPAGEGEMNAALAGERGVPVILVAGDAAYVAQARESYAATAQAVVTKTAVTNDAARLRPVGEVRAELREAARRAVIALDAGRPWRLETPVVVEVDYTRPTHAEIAAHIPQVERTGPFTVRHEAASMEGAYPMIRILYRFLSID